MKGCMEKDLKRHLTDFKILLANCLLSPTEKKENLIEIKST